MKRIEKTHWYTDDGQELLVLNHTTATVHQSSWNLAHLSDLIEALEEARDVLVQRAAQARLDREHAEIAS